MSHFTRLQTKIRDKDMLKLALKDLNLQVEEGQVEVRGYQGAIQSVDMVAHTKSDYDIGFYQKKDVFECVADWWGVERYSGIKQQSFMDKLSQRYAYHKTLQELENQGFYVAEEEITDEDVIEITVKWY